MICQGNKKCDVKVIHLQFVCNRKRVKSPISVLLKRDGIEEPPHKTTNKNTITGKENKCIWYNKQILLKCFIYKTLYYFWPHLANRFRATQSIQIRAGMDGHNRTSSMREKRFLTDIQRDGHVNKTFI